MEKKIRDHFQEMGYKAVGPIYRSCTGEVFVLGYKWIFHGGAFSATFVAQSITTDTHPTMLFTIPGTQMRTQNLDAESCLNMGLTKFREHVNSQAVR